MENRIRVSKSDKIAGIKHANAKILFFPLVNQVTTVAPKSKKNIFAHRVRSSDEIIRDISASALRSHLM